MNEKQKEEAIFYFRAPEFERLFILFHQKMQSLGQTGGSVVLQNATEVEKHKIGRWMNQYFNGKRDISVSLKRFEKPIMGSRFEPLTLWQIVELVLNVSIVSNKQANEEKEKQRVDFFTGLKEKYPSPLVELVMDTIIQRQKGANRFNTAYNQGEQTGIMYVAKSLYHLPVTPAERISVFSERMTGNPHYFEDHDNKLLYALEIIQSVEENREYRPKLRAYEENELYEQYGIARDDIMNFTTCTGLLAVRKGVDLQTWYYACEENIVMNPPLRELNKLDQVYPKLGKKVYVVENSGVFSSLLDRMEENVPLISTHGQFKLAGLILIDKLVTAGCTIYYAGDFDVGGLYMAYRLKRRHPKHVYYWRFTPEDYEISRSSVAISKERLKMLSSINDKELQPLINVILKEGKAGYQEKLIIKLYEDIYVRKKST
jgi:uncharacterized protein (TIGR02679 family)